MTADSAVALVLHGQESTDLGGPSMRVPKTVETLRAMGVHARLGLFPDEALALQRVRAAHVFNIWPHTTCIQALRFFRLLRIPTVLSPILLDHSRSHLWDGSEADPGTDRADGQHGPYRPELIGEAFRLADALVFLSRAEADLAASMGMPPRHSAIIRNPVDAEAFSPGEGRRLRGLVQAAQGAAPQGPLVLSVGRVEPRKNQLNLIRALAGTGTHLVLAGHELNEAYSRACREAAGGDVTFLGRLDNADGTLLDAYRSSAVYAHVSWSEGASLAALEAAAVGCPLVLGDLPGSREYFGPLADYVAPDDVSGIRTAVLARLTRPDPMRAALARRHVQAALSYESHARALAEVYRQVGAGSG